MVTLYNFKHHCLVPSDEVSVKDQGAPQGIVSTKIGQIVGGLKIYRSPQQTAYILKKLEVTNN